MWWRSRKLVKWMILVAGEATFMSQLGVVDTTFMRKVDDKKGAARTLKKP